MQIINWPGREDEPIKRIVKNLIRKIRGESNIDELIKRGMRVGEKLWVGDGCSFEWAFCYLISIGNNVVISNNVQIITHDSSLHKTEKKTRLGMVVIDDGAFIGARTLIMPNVQIGKESIIAAGSIVTKDVPPNEVWGGVPARFMCNKSDLIDKWNGQKYKIFDVEFLEAKQKQREIIIEYLKNNKVCYIE